MQPLEQSFIDKCKVESGFYMRGEAMTRIEVFVDAAFAFAVTMLVISIEQIPTSVPELMEVSKHIPAFVLSVVQLVWIWQTHSLWSKRYGLEDGKTVIMSISLLIVVLIYIYPLKMMFAGLFSWISGGFFPSEFSLNSYGELRHLFIYFAIGFTVVSGIFIWMYSYALKLREPLRLTEEEIFNTQTYIYIRQAMMLIGVLAIIAPMLVPDKYIPITGFCYSLIGIAYPLIESKRKKVRSNQTN